jgi:predicted transcriptional regulator
MNDRNAILISVKPEYVDLIFQGIKTIELRRRFCDSVTAGTKIFIYSTSPIKKLVGFAIVKSVIKTNIKKLWQIAGKESCVNYDYFCNYFNGIEYGYGIELEKPVLLKQQIGLTQLRAKKYMPPQSYMFVSDNLEYLLNNQ